MFMFSLLGCSSKPNKAYLTLWFQKTQLIQSRHLNRPPNRHLNFIDNDSDGVSMEEDCDDNDSELGSQLEMRIVMAS